MRFNVEPFERWYQDAKPLFRAHWELVGRHQSAIELDPDWEGWIALDRAGGCQCVTARIGWRLLGYAIHVIVRPLNYRTQIFAHAHVIYIDPAELAGMKALRFSRLIGFCDEALAARGVTRVFHHEKLDHAFGPMLERNGYQCFERLWDKLLVPGKV